jgi:hypothetical protein
MSLIEFVRIKNILHLLAGEDEKTMEDFIFNP